MLSKFRTIFLFIILIYIILLIFSAYPRYIFWLPSLFFYSDKKEADIVYKLTKERSYENQQIFYITDKTISNLFIDYVEEDKDLLDQYITVPEVAYVVWFFKYITNRARPYQINTNIVPLHSTTAITPSYPGGHTFQSYYLARKLGNIYPEKKEILLSLSQKVDEARIKAGIHYPSDGEFSRYIVDILFSIGIYK